MRGILHLTTMQTSPRVRLIAFVVAGFASVSAAVMAQRGRENNPFPGGTNPDGSLRPTPPLTRLFTQDAYTEYALLEPGSEEFRIRFLPEETRAGATELVNATRGGSEGSGIEVYDPRTGKPLQFTYEHEGNDPDSHAIHAKLPIPVPEGGIGRVLIYKTYKDPRTYMMNGEDIVWVRSLSGYRLGVLLPKGFAFISSNVAAQLTTTTDGRLKLAFANPSGQSNPVTIHARKTHGDVHAAPRRGHVLRRHQDALRPGRARERTHPRRADLQRLSQGRHGEARHAELLAMADVKASISTPRSRSCRPSRGGDASRSSKCRSSTTSRARTSGSRARWPTAATKSTTAISCSSGRCGTPQYGAVAGGMGSLRCLAIGHDRHIPGARVRRADQSERREQLQSDDPRAAIAALSRHKANRLPEAACSTCGAEGSRRSASMRRTKTPDRAVRARERRCTRRPAARSWRRILYTTSCS